MKRCAALVWITVVVFILFTGVVAAQSTPQVDGKINPGEYALEYTHDDSGVILRWTVADDIIYFGIQSPTDGWTGIGFTPEGPKKKGADLIVWYVEDGKLTIVDDFAYEDKKHDRDGDLGGTDDILQAAGYEEDDITYVEFARKLDTGDEYDNVISSGEMKLLLAYAGRDSLRKSHKKTDRWALDLVLAPAN